MRILLLAAIIGASALSQEDLASFWQRGRVRELLTGGTKQAPAEWAKQGVNCTMGTKPDQAHAVGMKTRSWFTMNAINPKVFGNDLDRIKAMCAIRENGAYLRPYDPLFPSVANNWSACVNNPLWREYSAKRFRGMAESGYDGCHIDYASHYEPCFCTHCEARWAAYAKERGLAAVSLRELPADIQHRMHLREFRILSVMDFLGMVREEARKVKPGFGTDGTWHQDSGSTYQWAYGDHFDLMCIEGTTWGPFPPESQQILWLKLSHALSRNKVGMSVTYHLINEGGERHHGRMASDRAKLALCEIMSQGAVSWIGLGGPKTGNLLREHVPMVGEVYTTWAQLETPLSTRTDIGDVGIVFSPRSYLVSGAIRKQLFAVGQALMKSHIPFVIHSDVGLTAKKLAQCPATVLLDAQALTPSATTALDAYVLGGGRLLMLGGEPIYAKDWSKLQTVGELLHKPKGEGLLSKDYQGNPVWYVPGDAVAGTKLGAAQNIVVNQQEAAPFAVEGESKALNVSGSAGPNYSVYVDLTHQDGSNTWGQVATFKTGTHGWESSRFVIKPAKPVKSANVHVLLRGYSGTAWFRKVRFGPWDAGAKKITTNLLGDGLNPGGGKTYVAGAGQDAAKGVWGPYAKGFEVEEIAGEGPTIKLAAGTDLIAVSPMHRADPVTTQNTLALLKPILPPSMLAVEGGNAEQVYCDVSLCQGGALLQLINYNAELHPELPELEQQKREHTIPVTNLRVRFTPPKGQRIKALTLKIPGAKDAELPLHNGSFTIPKLSQYAAVLVELAATVQE